MIVGFGGVVCLFGLSYNAFVTITRYLFIDPRATFRTAGGGLEIIFRQFCVVFSSKTSRCHHNPSKMSAWGSSGSARSCESLLKRVEANDPTLTELVVLPLKIFTATEVERLAKALVTTNTHLTSLKASGHAIEDVSALEALGAALAVSASMVEVAIGDSSMGDEGVGALCRGLESKDSFRLKRIDLSWKSM